MAITEKSNVSNTIEKRVSEIITETLIQDSVMLPNVMDRSSEVGPGMDRLDVPLLNALALQDVNNDGTAVTAQTITSQVGQLALDQFKTYAFSIPDIVQVQSKVALVQEQIKNGARVHAAEIDDQLLATAAAAVSDAAPDHLLALDGSDALVDLRAAKKLFDEANVPKQDRKWVASPGWMEKLFSSNNIIRANEFGSREGIAGGMVARIYGFEILESSSDELPADGYISYHKSTLHFARQIMPRFKREEKILEHREDYSLSQLYGTSNADPSGVRIVVGDADGVTPVA